MATLTRKHFVQVADLLDTHIHNCGGIDTEGGQALASFALTLAQCFARDNDNFDYDRFLRRSGVRND